jgi:hypothetical protein
MANVYSNCILTIAADGSSNSHDGCFYSHPSPVGLDTKEAVCVKSILSDGRASSIWIHSMHYNPNLESLETDPLARRAWAYQERALSPRILHFTQRQLFWECRRAFCGEDLVPRDHGSVQPVFVLQMRAQSDIISKIHVWCTWVLRHYTEASLTVPADRLPAISAMARLFYEEMKSPYIAGLWKEGLWYTLCWYRCDSENRASREGPYIAPSWSWASVNAPISWLIHMPNDKTVQLVTIEEIVVDSGRDPFGRVSSGSIRLKGRALLDQPLNKRGSAYDWYQYLDYPGEPPSHLDCILMAEDNTEKFLLLVARSSNNDKLYERHGVAGLNKSGIFGLDTSSWPVKTFTII